MFPLRSNNDSNLILSLMIPEISEKEEILPKNASILRPVTKLEIRNRIGSKYLQRLFTRSIDENVGMHHLYHHVYSVAQAKGDSMLECLVKILNQNVSFHF